MGSSNLPLVPSGIAARALEVSTPTVHNLVARGDLKAQRDAGGRLLIDPTDLARLVTARRAARAAKAGR